MTRIAAATLAVLTLAVLSTLAEPAAEDVDHVRVDRTITKEPKYVGEPLYALFLFGPEGKTRIWAVLDRSRADLAWRDVLYLDRDADGDLTDEGERFQGTYRESLARAGMAMTIAVGDLAIPGTDRVHRGLRFSTIPKTGRKGIWFTMRWCGEETVSGGAGLTGIDSTVWSTSPKTAPVLRPTVEAPLAFALWGADEVVLPVGKTTALSFQIGSRGSGSDTLCYVDDKFLDPAANDIAITLIAKDRAGRRIEERTVHEDLAPC